MLGLGLGEKGNILYELQSKLLNGGLYRGLYRGLL